MARFALAAHERHGTHAVPHVIRSRRKKLLLAGLRALGPIRHMGFKSFIGKGAHQ